MAMTRGEWLVTMGGSSSAKYATVISRHVKAECAERRASKERVARRNYDNTRIGVEHVDEFIKAGGAL